MTEPTDLADHDPTILATRALVERLRDTTYEGTPAPPPPMPAWWRYNLDEDAALRLVLDFTLTENTRTVLRRNERYAQLLHCAMLRLCDHGETANSSTLVREIRDLLGGA
jgi:hypothetical protein